jgi:hypothetical protein
LHGKVDGRSKKERRKPQPGWKTHPRFDRRDGVFLFFVHEFRDRKRTRVPRAGFELSHILLSKHSSAVTSARMFRRPRATSKRSAAPCLADPLTAIRDLPVLSFRLLTSSDVAVMSRIRPATGKSVGGNTEWIPMDKSTLPGSSDARIQARFTRISILVHTDRAGRDVGDVPDPCAGLALGHTQPK